MSVRVNLRLPDDLWGGVCTAADGVGQTRTMFVRRALEAALGESTPEARRVGVSVDTSPAPPRAPKPEPESKPMSADELRAWKRAQSNRGGRGVA